MTLPDVRSKDDPLYVLPLHAPQAGDSFTAGTKAANLSRLLAAGFPVPDGIVLTTAAFAYCTSQSDDDREAIQNQPLPKPVEDSLKKALASFGDAPLAVRSSGIAEDLAGASFAGQYETILDVVGFPAILDAIRKCWASAFSQQVRAYKSGHNIAEERMAVLIQPLVKADAAGVVFTANPVTCDRNEIVVSAVRGLGARLVSGEASPDEWLVRNGKAVCRCAPEGALREEDVLAVAELARKVEEHFGTSQDIEWALCGGQLYLLQARPISTLRFGETEVPLPAEPPPGFWERASSHYPQPLFPLTRSVLTPAANLGFRRMCSEFGLLTETVEEREIGGWMYLRAVPLGGKDRSPPPRMIMRLLSALVPSLRSRIRGCVEAIRSDKSWQWIGRWHAELKPDLIKRMELLRSRDLRSLSVADLDEHTAAVDFLLSESQVIHMLLNQSLNLLLAELCFACRDLFGWPEEKTFDLLVGLSKTSSAPSAALARIAKRAIEDPALAEAPNTALAPLLQDYQREYGHRTIGYELADPTLAEMPDVLLNLLRDQIRQGYDPEVKAKTSEVLRSRLQKEAREMLSARPAAQRQRFERALARAEVAYPIREEHGFYDTSMPLAIMRYTALEIGRRLVLSRQIQKKEDVFLLEIEEARATLRNGNPQHDLVRQRKRERAWALANPGPATYGKKPPGPPSFDFLPVEARFAHEAVFWFYEQVFATAANDVKQNGTDILKGIAASAGVYTGPVRIVRDESEFHKIKDGDVLVCPITSPAWSVLFSSVGALVTDVGGRLSHSAIIAREYQIPAVAATGNATQVLREGQIVTVDGLKGTVELKV